MEYNSFYGGRRGASFVIVHRFYAITKENFESATGATAERYAAQKAQDIAAAQKINPSYTEQDWYKEHIMVEAFKLGGDYEVVNYDEYVLIDTIDKNHKDNGKIFKRGYDYTNDLGGAIYEGQIQGPGGSAPHLNLVTNTIADEKINEAKLLDEKMYRTGAGEYSVANTNLIPGKDGSKYNDSITWKFASIRDVNDKDTEVWIGFTFPYLILEFNSIRTAPYKNGIYADMTAIERIDDKKHPFYEKWKLTIPDGVKGESLRNFRIYTPAADETMKDYNNSSYTLKANKNYLVYDYYNYDSKQNGDPKTLYLGVYDMIKNITVADNGTITITYTNKDTQTYTKLLKWITKVELTDEGKFTVTYNNDRTTNGQGQTYTTNLKWVKSLALAQNGTVTTTYNDNTTSAATTILKWINSIETANDGTVTYKDNTGATAKTQSKLIKWVTGSSYNASTGKLTFSYNTGATETYNYKYINSVAMTDKGVFTVKDNTGATMYSSTIKFMEKTAIPQEGQYRYHLLVMYNTQDGTITYNDGTSKTTGWIDLGIVKDYDGILVGLDIDSSKNTGLEVQSAAINYLNTNYPNGLQGNNLDGKIVAIGRPTMTKKMYAYNYSTKKWFYLGSTDSSSDVRQVLVGKEGDAGTEALADEMAPGSIWFPVIDD